jgi:REP element-mobilizing transposase RayT
MSGDKYFIREQNAIHFLTLTVVEWIDIFTRKDYKLVITDALNYCIREKGLIVHAWVLMSYHLHLIVQVQPPFRLSDVLRDFKKFTSKKMATIVQDINESRKDWMLHQFSHMAKVTGRAEVYKIWQDSNHAVNLEGGGERLVQKIEYIHNNPVRQLIVSRAEDYLFSSAIDYTGVNGLVKVDVIM